MCKYDKWKGNSGTSSLEGYFSQLAPSTARVPHLSGSPRQLARAHVG